MRFDDGCGLDIVAALKKQRSEARAIILIGYGNIASRQLNSALSTISRSL